MSTSDPDGLTPQARKLLGVLRERGDWTNRAELASALGQIRLTVYDTGAIEIMAQKELIEIRVSQTTKRGRVVEYKAK